jgi:hypothetical protein
MEPKIKKLALSTQCAETNAIWIDFSAIIIVYKIDFRVTSRRPEILTKNV